MTAEFQQAQAATEDFPGAECALAAAAEAAFPVVHPADLQLNLPLKRFTQDYEIKKKKSMRNRLSVSPFFALLSNPTVIFPPIVYYIYQT